MKIEVVMLDFHDKLIQYPVVNNFLLLFGRTDDKGIICDQRGVFRVNCMDCLDRTNVVQAALARHIMEQQVNEPTDKQTN